MDGSTDLLLPSFHVCFSRCKYALDDGAGRTVPLQGDGAGGSGVRRPGGDRFGMDEEDFGFGGGIWGSIWASTGMSE